MSGACLNRQPWARLRSNEMKYPTSRPFADPEVAGRKLLEIANASEAVQDGRIHIEKLNGPFLLRKAAARPSTPPGSNSPSRTAGYGGTSRAPS